MAIGQFSPGPDMLLLTKTSLQHGAKAGCLTACGVATGLSVHSAIALTGGAWLFSHQSPLLWWAKCAASLYLIYLAITILLSLTKKNVSNESSLRSGRSHFYLRGLLCNLLNPKAAIFLTSICAPFLGPSKPASQAPILGLIIVVQGAVLWMLWALLLQWRPLRDFYHRTENKISIVFATMLLLLACQIWRS
jgi:threonine efflux protein